MAVECAGVVMPASAADAHHLLIRASSASVHGVLRPVVAPRTSFTCAGAIADAEFPHDLRMYVRTDAT